MNTFIVAEDIWTIPPKVLTRSVLAGCNAALKVPITGLVGYIHRVLAGQTCGNTKCKKKCTPVYIRYANGLVGDNHDNSINTVHTEISGYFTYMEMTAQRVRQYRAGLN
jgi:hypothetical protein